MTPEPAADNATGPQPAAAKVRRLALGLSYRGSAYRGWQSQREGVTVQDTVEAALAAFATVPMRVHCAGRTDSGVHAVQQVIHFDTALDREPQSWVRGTNRYLPADVAVQWCVPVHDGFHARNSAVGRTYRYWCVDSSVRPSLHAGLVGWVHRPLDVSAMRAAAEHVVGEHDFSAFRSSQCQATSPVKHLRRLGIEQHGRWYRFEFEASAFLHHMVRNLMGMLVTIGQGAQPSSWMLEVRASRSRVTAAPTFSAEGLYFLGPTYAAEHEIPKASDDAQGAWPLSD